MEMKPKLQLEKTIMEMVLDLLTAILLISIILDVVMIWKELPQSIPKHFNLYGVPDSFGGKESLLVLLIVPTVLFMLFSILSKFPHTFNYLVKITEENAYDQYKNAQLMMGWLKLELILLFVYNDWMTIEIALGRKGGLGIVPLILELTSVFVTIGVFLLRSYRLK